MVDAAHDDADPDVEAPSGRCVACWVLDADDGTRLLEMRSKMTVIEAV